MTIIVNEEEFITDYRNLLDRCDSDFIIIQREDGQFFSLNSIDTLPENHSKTE